ncbi:sigma-54 dependent transcriptional regulator [Desulfatitalea tepidiphila]|uniref:sigma-54 dependent transcriptional regulator n=1 Tax=Desulfatitalea tepidiphila TaxID=1185843 RepID=UPI0006B5AA31|nr:sigma-54 dependent transcriptional regulator [Desulfatitalea tepidiphila]
MPEDTSKSPQSAKPTVRIICLDSQRDLCRQTKAIFGADDNVVVSFEKSFEKVLDLVEHEVCDVMLATSTLVRDGRMDWLEYVEMLTAKSPWTQVIFLIKPRELVLASKALKAGSYHYAKLPVSDEELKLLVEAALESRPSVDPNSQAIRQNRKTRFEDMVGVSANMKNVYRMIRQAAATDIPVLLTGETGVGKDLAARAIHQLSARVDKPFQVVHLGALPPDLAANELFGHAKGAFTGAGEARAGAFERAHGGTVFMDEIATIDDRVQISLLRLIESKRFHRIGGSRTIDADVRLIAATNEPLEDAVEGGRFREDLYYRLEVFQIPIPPLRDRPGDIPLLIQDFLQRYNRDYDKRIIGLSPETMSILNAYEWPGNVRELKNVIHRAVVVCTGEVITPQHLSKRIRPGDGSRRNIILPVGTSFEEAERKLLEKTLQATGNSRRYAAAILGVSRGTLYNKIKKYGVAKIHKQEK